MTNAAETKYGKIIFLHGASSSGKSTIAKHLQSLIEEPFWHISIDHLRDAGVLPSKRIADGDFKWSHMRKNFFDGYHHSLVAYAQMGNNLIVEHILDTPGWAQDLSEMFAPFDVFFVGIHCPLHELTQRELARGNRKIGSAAQDFAEIHKGLIYDLNIDTTNKTEQNDEYILDTWRKRSKPTGFNPFAE